MRTRQRPTPGTASPPHPVLEQTYAAVVEAQQWSPADLSPDFDLAAFVATSYRQVGQP